MNLRILNAKNCKRLRSEEVRYHREGVCKVVRIQISRFSGCGKPTDLIRIISMLCLLFGMRLNIDEFTSFLTGREHYHSVDESEESVVLAHSDIETGMVLSAALTFDDIAGFAL